MILWTIQSEEAYYALQKAGVYHCDSSKIFFPEFKPEYDWLASEMRERIGRPPDGVQYPIWAWFMWEGTRKKPDLRRERWANGFKGDKFVCLEIDIPEEQVLLHDFDVWSYILVDPLGNRDQLFDVSHADSIQATFWEMRSAQVNEVRWFEGALEKPKGKRPSL